MTHNYQSALACALAHSDKGDFHEWAMGLGVTRRLGMYMAAYPFLESTLTHPDLSEQSRELIRRQLDFMGNELEAHNLPADAKTCRTILDMGAYSPCVP